MIKNKNETIATIQGHFEEEKRANRQLSEVVRLFTTPNTTCRSEESEEDLEVMYKKISKNDTNKGVVPPVSSAQIAPLTKNLPTVPQPTRCATSSVAQKTSFCSDSSVAPQNLGGMSARNGEETYGNTEVQYVPQSIELLSHIKDSLLTTADAPPVPSRGNAFLNNHEKNISIPTRGAAFRELQQHVLEGADPNSYIKCDKCLKNVICYYYVAHLNWCSSQ